MKRLNVKDVKVGMKVVLNDLDDATIYTVSKVTGFRAELYYTEHGIVYDGGVMDAGMLGMPSKVQLSNQGK
jgi:hypothetical protein